MNFILKRFIKDYENVENADVRSSYGKFASIVGIILNIILFVGKLIVGILCSSLSISADAINNLSDASSSIISLFGFALASKPADKEHPFGHGRYEYISALIVAIMIIVIGVELFKSSIEKIINPTEINFSIISIVIMVASILVKLGMMIFYRNIGKRISSQALFAVAQDSRNDIISTAVVLFSIIISYKTGFLLDGYMALAVSIFILISGFGLVRETLNPILGKMPDEEFVKELNAELMKYPKVLDTHDLIIHDYGPGRLYAGVHVEMSAEDDVLECHDIIDNIENDFMKKFNLQLIIHYDPVLTNDETTRKLKSLISEKVKDIDSRLTIHDFRTVPGPTHTNVLFDCVVPRKFTLSNREVSEKIDELVKNINPTYNSVVKIEHSFTGEP
ncbi:MAG: cation diffusion facilitator family transporter [Clostridia bacterium]|nr:cation diffusion facilitator family transporter [Clostridia bacterium]